MPNDIGRVLETYTDPHRPDLVGGGAEDARGGTNQGLFRSVQPQHGGPWGVDR